MALVTWTMSYVTEEYTATTLITSIVSGVFDPLLPIALVHLYYSMLARDVVRPTPSVHAVFFCPNCGERIQYVGNVCHNCGTQLHPITLEGTNLK